MYNIGIEFEYDQNKSGTNFTKHGLTFEDAKKLWFVENIYFDLRHKGERRLMIIGFLKGKCYSCIFTVRGAKIRIISVRRSREEEETRYREK